MRKWGYLFCLGVLRLAVVCGMVWIPGCSPVVGMNDVYLRGVKCAAW